MPRARSPVSSDHFRTAKSVQRPNFQGRIILSKDTHNPYERRIATELVLLKSAIAFVLTGLCLAHCLGCAQTRPSQRVAPRFAQQEQTQAVYPVQQAGVVEAAQPQQLEELPRDASVGHKDASLSIEQLQEIALHNNPSLSEAYARIQAVRGRWVQAGLMPNPIVGYSGQQLGSGGEAEQHGVLIFQKFVRGRKLRLSREVAAQEIQQAQQQLAAQRLRVLTDVRIGYYDVLATQQKLELSQRLVDAADKAEKIAAQLLAAGDVNKVAHLQARVEAEAAWVQVQNSRNELNAAWRRTSAVIGVPDFVPRWLDDSLDNFIPSIQWEEALTTILSQSPEIADALFGVERARRAFARARVEPTPNLDVEAVIQSDNSTNSTNGNLVVGLPLPVFDRNQGSIQEAKSEMIASQRTVGRIELGLQQRLAAVFQRYENARNQVERYSRDDGVLENAKRTLDLVTSLYEGDDISYLNLLTAQRTYFRTNLTYIESLRQMWIAVAEIEGALLHNSLNNN